MTNFRAKNVVTSTKNFEITILPLKDKNLENYSTIEKALCLVNFVLFTSVFMHEMDSEVKGTMIFIMSTIFYFVATNICLTGAAQIKGLFNLESSQSTDCDDTKSMA